MGKQKHNVQKPTMQFMKVMLCDREEGDENLYQLDPAICSFLLVSIISSPDSAVRIMLDNFYPLIS